VRRSMVLAAVLAATVLLGLSAAPALAQSAGQTIDVGGWKVTRTHKADGSFEQCSSNIKYDDKSILAFAVNAAGKVFLVIVEPDFKLIEGQTYKAKYRLDKTSAVSADAVAADKTTLVIPVANEDAFMPAAMAGNNLVIEAGGETVEEPLAGSKDAINQLATCVAAGMKGS
jgi:hypothetical protein